MSSTPIQIVCPQCGHRFFAEEALRKQMSAKFEKEYAEKTARQAAAIEQQRALLASERQLLETQRQEQDEIIQKRLQEEKIKIAEQARLRAADSVAQELQALRNENEQRRKENLELQKKEVEWLQRENRLKEDQERLQIEVEKRLLEGRATIEAKIKATEAEKFELRFKEYEKKLQDQKKLIEEMKRKAEQGSMQMQGEVQELALKDLLRRQFPFDRIEEVAKGVRGADVIQVVVDPMQRECGKIIFESKRTKAFSQDWIAKLKVDQIEQGADIAVIVTEVMPNDMDRFGEKQGVWICDFHEAKSLTLVLREMLLRMHSERTAHENKGDKIEMVYRYLTSVEFKQRVEAIVEGFTELRNELDREQQAMRRIWKSREKQIDKIISNTVDMYGCVKGIAGSSIENIPSLELPHLDESDGEQQE